MLLPVHWENYFATGPASRQCPALCRTVHNDFAIGK